MMLRIRKGAVFWKKVHTGYRVTYMIPRRSEIPQQETKFVLR